MTDPYLALLVGEPEGSGQARIEVGEADATTLARLLQEMFARRLDIDRVELVTHGRTLGVAGRNRLARMLATVPRGPGDSDLGRLPGVPSYDLILFECGTCGQVTGVVHVDERTPPVCAAGHGPLQGPV